MSSQEIPAQARYMPMILDALRDQGGSAKASSVKNWISNKLANMGVDVPQETLSSGADKFTNDVQWARMYLVKAGFVEPKSNSGHGVWKLTGLGWTTAMTPEQAVQAMAGHATAKKTEPPPEDNGQQSLPGLIEYRKKLHDILKDLKDTGFERLCRHIMAVTGIENAVVTGKSGDGGIDGQGYMAFGQASLVKVMISWQCKRFKDSKVGSTDVRNFRGSMDGKAIFGMIFTTSHFTDEAIKEAQRTGSIRVELVDVEKLVDVMCENEIGVTRTMQPVYTINDNFFETYKNPPQSVNPAQMELKP
jgi:restriction system protein